jgi:ribosomal-protein-alanine N-acetyltransferase
MGQGFFRVEPMTLEDVEQVAKIEQEAFTAPWPARAFRYEILENEQSTMLVVRPAPHGSRLAHEFLSAFGIGKPRLVLGYGGFWLLVDEVHISTLAVHSQWRGRGLGELLLISLLDRGLDLGGIRSTLEVRVSNRAAQELYQRVGYQIVSRQKRYYADNNEDAYIMVAPDIRGAAFQSHLRERRELLRSRMEIEHDS